MNFGIEKLMGDNTNKQTVWGFGLFNSGTKLGVKLGDDDAAGGMAQWRADGNFNAEAWVALGPVVLKVGNTERDWAQWSSLDYKGNNNWAFGAAASTDAPFIEVAYVADPLKVYFGFSEAGVSGKFLGSKLSNGMKKGAAKPSADAALIGYIGAGYQDAVDAAQAVIDGVIDGGGTPTTAQNDALADAKADLAAFNKALGGYGAAASKPYAPFPGFYLGGDYALEGIGTFGAAFAGQYVGGESDEKGTFPLMFNLHGRVTMVEPLTIGLNLAFYMAPMNAPGFFAITQGDAAAVIGGDKAMVLEALLDVSANLDPLKVGFSAAYVMNFANKDDFGGGSALKIGLNANIGIGDTGFKIIPGIVYTNFMKVNNGTEVVNGKAGSIDGGLTLAYSF